MLLEKQTLNLIISALWPHHQVIVNKIKRSKVLQKFHSQIISLKVLITDFLTD